jgi:ZIP family zinc transporter
LHPEFPEEALPEGPPVRWRRSALLMVAITVHNFPEGLAVGVAYGSNNVGAATALAIGIGLQNIPEGLAIALPLRREGMSRWKAFWYGQLSAAIEPVAGILGAGLVLASRSFLPYGMAAAAGAMLYCRRRIDSRNRPQWHDRRCHSRIYRWLRRDDGFG